MVLTALGVTPSAGLSTALGFPVRRHTEFTYWKHYRPYVRGCQRLLWRSDRPTSQRIVDAMMSFPAIILAIAIMASLGASVNNAVIALSVIYIPSTARILRSQALAIKETDYDLASRAVGSGHWRIILRHMIPNCFAVYIVIVTFHLGGAIIAEASLSFLGVGSPPDVPTWGGMLREGPIRSGWRP